MPVKIGLLARYGEALAAFQVVGFSKRINPSVALGLIKLGRIDY
jgi:hypothetical protein